MILIMVSLGMGRGLSQGYMAQISVLLGNGDGTFRSAQNYQVGVYPRFVAIADFNRDGLPDLVVANVLGYVTVLLNGP